MKASVLRTWGRLLRLPNLFTVPGDPIAGFMLASGGVASWRMAWAALVSLCLYAAGLLLNDYFDRDVDARERPERPIPSGAVRAGTVLAVGLVLLCLGVVISFAAGGPMKVDVAWYSGPTQVTYIANRTVSTIVAAAVALAVLGYDAGLKRIPVLGQVVMGSCRAGSLLVGASLVQDSFGPAVLVAAGVAWAYTTSLTFVAAGETSGRRPGWGANVPGLVLLAGGLAMLVCSMVWHGITNVPFIGPNYWGLGGPDPFRHAWCVDRAGVVAVLLLLIGIAEAELSAFGARRGGLPTPAFIGRLIRVMITVQAVWVVWTLGPCLGSGRGGGAVACVVAGYLVLRWLAGMTARRFYGS